MIAAIMAEKEYWILWNQLYGEIGPKRFDQLLEVFGSAERAWKAPAREFARLGWPSKALEKLKIRDEVAVTTNRGIDNGVGYKVITREESGYPESLTQIPSSPPVLYTRGELLPQDRLSLAVVGSRKMTKYGREVVEALVPELAAAGLTIVSGLALGVDTAVHRAALSVSGRTIAVLPCGIDRVYPSSNQGLAKQIIGSGALVSEFPVGMPLSRANWAIRNRIISGFSLGVLVIEAAAGSGTFHTVTAALEQGKDVFAVPGSIFSPYSAGTAKLIQRGAKPVTSAADILEELEISVANLGPSDRTATPRPSSRS